MIEKKKIIGQILEKKIDEKAKFVKYTFTIQSEGRKMNLGLFISENDKEGLKLKKEGMIKDFKKGDTAEFTYYNKVEGDRTYHNIIEISEIEEDANKKYNVVELGGNLEKEFTKPVDFRQLDIFKGQCLNLAVELITSKNQFEIKDIEALPRGIFNLTKMLFDEGKKQKFLEWK